MPVQWIKTKYTGVRYYDHPTRKHGAQYDKYFSIRYQRDKKRMEEGLGWASDGWTAEKAALQLAELKRAHKKGDGPIRLREKRELEKAKREQIQLEKENNERESITYKEYFKNNYMPVAKTSKKEATCNVEEILSTTWIEPVIGDKSFKDISAFHMEIIKKNLLDKNKKPRTIKYCFAVIQQVWNQAKRDSIIDSESPTKQVKIPKIDNRRLRFLTHKEAQMLLNHLHSKSEQLYRIALLSLHCGLRAGEIFNLTWGDIDLNREIITIRDPKGVKTRTAYMTGEIKTMLEQMKPQNRTDLIFTDKKGNKVKAISNSFERVIKDIGFNEGVTDTRQKVVFHTLRHTFASWLVENGTDLYTVKELLGHSSIAMTERYSHLGANTLQNAVKSLEKKIAESQEKNSDNIINLNS